MRFMCSWVMLLCTCMYGELLLLTDGSNGEDETAENLRRVTRRNWRLWLSPWGAQ